MMSYQSPFISPFCLPSGKADDTPISGSCVHKSMPKLAVDDYGFALGRLGSGVSSTFDPSGLINIDFRVFLVSPARQSFSGGGYFRDILFLLLASWTF